MYVAHGSMKTGSRSGPLKDRPTTAQSARSAGDLRNELRPDDEIGTSIPVPVCHQLVLDLSTKCWTNFWGPSFFQGCAGHTQQLLSPWPMDLVIMYPWTMGT